MEDIDSLKDFLLDEEEYHDLSELFKMFSDPTRLRIFTVLAQGAIRVDDLRLTLDMTQSAISHQLSSLRKLNLVKTRRVGRNIYYSLSDDHVMQIFMQALEHVRE
ncbi:metalloregulator ArsR/SmtB family transcription factor [Erysipelothrix urinaevulpis]|uniref:ArsR/SmtB family transcription factor n=1 Tax=Erysipelothrix urinaevulpis TaxID=2683717 RepID=UPI001F3DCB84|nr:metalloregulator ArsR/SmtB family transcription factor [Erysipelothrix urinaevulpis]